MNLEIGTLVRLRPEARLGWTCPEGRDDNDTAPVKALCEDGVIFTACDLHGCRFWNADDLEVAECT